VSRPLAICVAAALSLGACGSSSNAPAAPSCAPLDGLDGGAACAADGPTYEANIQPILARSCLPACHDDSPDAAWPLTDFDDIKAWTTYVVSDIIHCTMPPAGSTLTITNEERSQIVRWLGCGNPQ
jgi:hypothetical protein